MSTFVLTEETSQTPVGDVLAARGDPVIEIRDAPVLSWRASNVNGGARAV